MHTMAPKLTDTERARIIDLCQQGLTRNDIAHQLQRSPDSISRVARTVGHRFGQTNLARAHEARSSYAAEARSEVAKAAVERAKLLLAEFEASQPVVSGTADGPVVVHVELDARGQKDRAQAMSTLMRTVIDIDRHDNAGDQDASSVDAWLAEMTGGPT